MATLEDRRRGSPSGEEELRFIRNFHDVFLSIGLLMFAVGLGIVSVLIEAKFLGGIGDGNWRRAAWITAGVAAADAAVMWGLGEVFARTRRLFLPSIVILSAFLVFVFGAVSSAYVATFGEQEVKSVSDAVGRLKLLPLTMSGTLTAATFLFYLRTKLPFAMGLVGAGLALSGASAIAWRDHAFVVAHGASVFLAAGLFIFALGVFFDARDPERRTRLSDNGFWLHFFAAPLIFVPTLALTRGGVSSFEAAFDVAAAATTLVVVCAFALISLLINRRALLVSGLLSATFAIAVLVRETGLDGAWTAAFTLLLLGGAMVLLGGGWRAVRRVLVAPFPKTGLIARIIPPESPPGERGGDHGE